MAARRVSAYRALASESRVTLLRLLQQEGAPMSVDALAEAIDLHVNTTREHLDCLIGAGLVARHPEVRCTRGRPRMLYSAVERVDAETSSNRVREEMARILVAGYGQAVESPTVAAEHAGFAWGDRLSSEADDSTAPPPSRTPARAPADAADPSSLAQLAALEARLDALGFEPEADPETLEVHMHGCPFYELAQESPEVVCSVLLGVSRGVLAHVGGPLTAAQLDAFVGPRHCVLHLARTSDDEAGRATAATPVHDRHRGGAGA
ncbi:metalloregulator ArsR/SmtB family transcription factor [Cellulomonas sp. P24]|uniref:helix-turn-helix transcriptional regulator n=1 Tax=Cellulomonas sp. P24 TaxID=2885206 RepID=UPI00216B5904|nr:helix-turn-helix domain-containing protein [Cellulomonas sp. P24]MCR6491810.1 helix-turn-helix domain-containing protein [Cellulomonas sp. P24]